MIANVSFTAAPRMLSLTTLDLLQYRKLWVGHMPTTEDATIQNHFTNVSFKHSALSAS